MFLGEIQKENDEVKLVTFVTPSVTVIRDEAKIVEQIEKTRRLKIYLPYGVAMALICTAVKLAEHF